MKMAIAQRDVARFIASLFFFSTAKSHKVYLYEVDKYHRKEV